MQMVKIQIPDKKESAKALVEMSRRGRVLCFADDVYIVPEPALELLGELAITYQELGRGASIMRKRRYEMLLPLKYNDGRSIEDDKIYQTREELIARFDSITVLPGHVQGVWVHKGTRYEDAACDD